MTKYTKKIGTKAYKFLIELQLDNIELPSYHSACRVSVVFKRGEHKVLTKNAPLLENGVAYFNESLLMPTTLYFDKKKNCFLEKEASLVVSTLSNKGNKIAGVTKLDLAAYPNLSIREKKESLPIMRAVDKSSRINCAIRIVQMEELDTNMTLIDDDSLDNTRTINKNDDHDISAMSKISRVNDNPFEEFGKVYQDEILTERTRNLYDMTVSIKAKSLSPYRPTIEGVPPEKITRDNSQDIVVVKKVVPKIISTNRLESNVRPGAITPKGVSRTITKLPEEKKKQQLLEKKPITQTVTKDENSKLKSYILELETQIKQSQLERKDLAKRIDQLQQQNNYYKTETEDLSKQVENLMNLYETINSDRKSHPQDKRTESEIKILKDQIASLEEQLEEARAIKDKEHSDSFLVQSSVQGNFSPIDSRIIQAIKQEKDLEIKALIKRLQEAGENYNELRESLKVREISDSKSTIIKQDQFEKIQEFESVIQIQNQKIKQQAEEIENLQNKLSNLPFSIDHSSRSGSATNSEEKFIVENYKLKEENNSLKHNLGLASNKVDALEKDQKALEAELQLKNLEIKRLESIIHNKKITMAQGLIKQDSIALSNSDICNQTELEYSKSYQKHEEENQNQKKNLQARIEALEKENQLLVSKNKLLEQTQQEAVQRSNLHNNSSLHSVEEEKRLVIQENEKLRETEKTLISQIQKLKTENGDLKQKYDCSLIERQDLSKLNHQIVLLEATIQNYESDLAKAKMGWNEAENERDSATKHLKSAQERVKALTSEKTQMSSDLMVAKSNLGAVLNTIFEHGGAELLDKCEKFLSH